MNKHIIKLNCFSLYKYYKYICAKAKKAAKAKAKKAAIQKEKEAA
jgi:hypothetical protein